MELTLEQKIGQMLTVGFEGQEPPDYILEWLAAGQVGGVVLFSRNIGTPEQVARLTQTCREAASLPILISIDQEGGRVARLRQGFTESPGAMALGTADSESLAERVAEALGAELYTLGINWALAPVVDVAHNSENPVIGTRALGADPARVAALAAAQIRGFQRAGVATTAKHFPGHGNTPVDTHVDMAVVSGALDVLWQSDLVPFRASVAAGVDVVMVSHVKFEALDPAHPSTLSTAVVTGLLRDEVGFQGMACTDCMEMQALDRYYDVGERAVLAAQAGADHMFFSHTRAHQEEAYYALVQAAYDGTLSHDHIDGAARRVLTLKARYPVNPAPDLTPIRQAEHLALMQEAARAGTALLKSDPVVFPLHPDQRPLVVEFVSHIDTQAMESGRQTGLAVVLGEKIPGIPVLSLKPTMPDAAAIARAMDAARAADVVIVATRNAHLWDAQREAVLPIMQAARHIILLCLADPYDAEVLSPAGTVICTCGDALPSLHAAADALLGRYTPAGRLPVALR